LAFRLSIFILFFIDIENRVETPFGGQKNCIFDSLFLWRRFLITALSSCGFGTRGPPSRLGQILNFLKWIFHPDDSCPCRQKSLAWKKNFVGPGDNPDYAKERFKCAGDSRRLWMRQPYPPLRVHFLLPLEPFLRYLYGQTLTNEFASEILPSEGIFGSFFDALSGNFLFFGVAGIFIKN
jgi:hypothetical protein